MAGADNRERGHPITIMPKVDCTGLESHVVLAQLYNHASPVGMGFLQSSTTPMTLEEAKNELARTQYFDYLYGRPLKTDFSNYPELDSHGYDRDQGGPGTMQSLVDKLKESQETAEDGKPVVDETVNFEQKSREQTLKDCEGGLSIHVLHNGKPMTDFPDIKKFHTVRFVDSFCKELGEAGIPYPNEWHVYMGESDGKADFVGSVGGGFSVNTSARVVKSVGHEMGI